MIVLYIVISIDVEDPSYLMDIFPDYEDESKSMIYCKIKGEYFGYHKLMNICDDFDAKATFFLEVFDYKRYGENIFKDICREIIENGHDVQLHVHPNRCYDSKRLRMEEYSLEEQNQIIKSGKLLIENWTGRSPVAYRGGMYYSINKDTLIALRENNIPIDSTMFYGNPDCRFVLSKNKVIERYGIVEIPITVFRRNIKLFGFNLWNAYVKTDINWATLHELKFFVREAKKNDVKVMNLFMHSYSLIDFNKDFTELKPDYDCIEKFTTFLEHIQDDSEIQVITMSELYGMYKKDQSLFVGSDYIPKYEVNALHRKKYLHS